MRAEIRLLPDGRRLHLHDGPIDLVIEAFGARAAVRDAYDAAVGRFVTVLDELCEELALLRAPAKPGGPAPRGAVARRMWAAVEPFSESLFITPMAAVAGAVADEILSVMRRAAAEGLTRAYVNNGGDVALHLSPGESFVVGLIDRPDRPSLFGETRIVSGTGVGGLATSGWRGRSFSFGIADAATILARNAACADAAATLVANATDLPGHPSIRRRPAREIEPDSDLEDRSVTCAVGPLTETEAAQALAAGRREASRFIRRGFIIAAALHLAGETIGVGPRDVLSGSPQTRRNRLIHA